MTEKESIYMILSWTKFN